MAETAAELVPTLQLVQAEVDQLELEILAEVQVEAGKAGLSESMAGVPASVCCFSLSRPSCS